MEIRQEWLTGLKAAIALFAGFWFGLEPLVGLLIVFMAVDFVTGVLNAYNTKTIRSSVSFKGLTKKVFILILVGVAQLMENYVTASTGTHIMLGEATAAFYAFNEGISILENAAAIGLPVPQALKDALAKLNPEQPAGGAP